MRDFSFGRVSTLKFKCIALVLLAIGFIVVFIPLWQIGVENSFRQQMIKSQIRLNELDGEERALKASASIYLSEDENQPIYVQANNVI